MLHVLAQSHTAGMGTNGNSELSGHQHDGQHLIDPAQPAAVDLAEPYRPGLKQLFENDAILAGLPGGDADRFDCPGNRGVPEHVVVAGGLLYPSWIEPLEMVSSILGTS